MQSRSICLIYYCHHIQLILNMAPSVDILTCTKGPCRKKADVSVNLGGTPGLQKNLIFFKKKWGLKKDPSRGTYLCKCTKYKITSSKKRNKESGKPIFQEMAYSCLSSVGQWIGKRSSNYPALSKWWCCGLLDGEKQGQLLLSPPAALTSNTRM